MDNNLVLDQIFSITSDLYKQMCVDDSDASNDHAEIFRLLTELSKTLVNADRASFWKWDKRNHEIWTTAAVGTGRITIPEGTGLVGKSLAEGKPIVTNDPYNHPDFNSAVDKKTGYVTKSILVMPVSNCKGEFIGAYQAINKLDNDGKFDIDEDVRKLSLAAFICGITLESETFLDDSMHDKLTELKNRMGFHHDYKNTYEKLLKNEKEFHTVSLFICDIDFFKKVNDTLGHEAGDRMIFHFANLLRNTFPGSGVICRWGGDEFSVLLTGVSRSQLEEHIRRLLHATEEYNGKNPNLPIYFAVGAALSDEHPKLSRSELFHRADEEMYRNKQLWYTQKRAVK